MWPATRCVPPALTLPSRRAVRARGLVVVAITCVLVAWAASYIPAQSAPPPAFGPGVMADGSTMLPNGWRLSPAGKHLKVGDLPLNVLQTPDSRYLIVTNN